MKKLGLVLAIAACGRESAGTTVPPRFGLAVSDTAGAWCAEFKNDSTRAPIEAGQQVTIVFSDSSSTRTLEARVRAPRSTECWAAFPQPRWIDYTAYDLDLVRPAPPGGQTPTVGLIAAGAGLGSLQARRCTADEGEHFTVWEPDRGGAQPRRVWHEYYDWGAFTDPTCRQGEKGVDSTRE